MGNTMKVLWSIISIVPILFVLTVLCYVDYFSDKILFNSIAWLIVLPCLIVILSVALPIVLKVAKKTLELKELKVIEAEPKDSELATSMISYLLPLVTLSLNEFKIYVFVAMMIVLILLLITTRIISFNPLALFGGYRYYKVKLESGMCYTVLTRSKKYNFKNSNVYVELFNGLYLEV